MLFHADTCFLSTSLGSGIISAGLQCEDTFCPTNGDINLNQAVIITIEHSEEVKVSGYAQVMINSNVILGGVDQKFQLFHRVCVLGVPE